MYICFGLPNFIPIKNNIYFILFYLAALDMHIISGADTGFRKGGGGGGVRVTVKY